MESSYKSVLILVNHDITIYNFRKELVEQLISDGFQVHISSPNGGRINLLKKMGCHFIDTEMERHGINPFQEIILLKSYLRIMKDLKPEVVLTFTIKPNIYGGLCASMLNIPYITNITGLGSSIINPSIMQKLLLTLYRASLKKSGCILFQNKSNQAFFIEKGITGRKNRLLCGSGVNLKEFSLLPFPADIRFAFISRVMKEKGINEFLECAKKLKIKYPDVGFDVCGFCEENYENQLLSLDKAGTITYHGMISKVKKILEKVQCVVLPSYHEGMSNTLLEAAATGRVLIASDIPGCREIIEDGKNGYCCKVKDSQSLEHAMEQFINLTLQDKYKMGLAGRKKMEIEFDRRQVVNAYMVEIDTIQRRNTDVTL